MKLILLPHQCFPLEHLPKETTHIVFLQHPYFFIDPIRNIHFSQQKCIFLALVHLLYIAQLKQKYKVEFIPANVFNLDHKHSVINHLLLHYSDSLSGSTLFFPYDHIVLNELVEVGKILPKPIHILPYSPYSIQSLDTYNEYTNITPERKKLFHHHFYAFQRKSTNILMKDGAYEGGSISYDKMNRQKMNDIGIQALHSIPNFQNRTKIPKALYKEAHNIIHSLKTFGKSPGKEKDFMLNYTSFYGTSRICDLPLTTKDAKRFVDHFIQYKLPYFGKYQDAMYIDPKKNKPVQNRSYEMLFHSFLSPLLNCGLLTPKYVIDKVISYYEQHKETSLLYSTEGIVRQILGWREFSLYTYCFFEKRIKQNKMKHHRKLEPYWYSSSKPIPKNVPYPVQDCIHKAWNNAYLHHIERLMVIANFMTITNVDPNEMYTWFMTFPLDSYDWVMTNNVYSMGSYADGGFTMTKPYISGSNYIRKMSNYPSGEWENVWDALYYVHLLSHFKLYKQIPRMAFLLKGLKKKTKKEMTQYQDIKTKFYEHSK